MNREIKFRVWDILNKRIKNYGEIMDLPMWEVLPGTPEQRAFEVMEYTGLKDKNDKEIYEGDILEVRHFTPTIVNKSAIWYENVRVIYSNKIGGFITIDSHGKDNLIFNRLSKIIGNIYERPELLEAKNE